MGADGGSTGGVDVGRLLKPGGVGSYGYLCKVKI